MIALFAGTGALPGLVAARLTGQGRRVIVCQMAGFAATGMAGLPLLPYRIETLGTLLSTLTRLGVAQVCMAGALRRPGLDPAAIDAATLPLIPRLRAAMAQGDDGALRDIIALFQEHGLSVIAASDIAPDLLPPPGCPTRIQPPSGTAAAAICGQACIAALGRTDRGQACVIRLGAVLAEEGPGGTDAMLAALPRPADAVPDGAPGWQRRLAGEPAGTAADRVSNAPCGRDGILYKAPKPGQDRRADLPVIGPDTARAAAAAGLAGIVIAAGGVMVLDLPQVVAVLDRQGLFLWVRPEAVP